MDAAGLADALKTGLLTALDPDEFDVTPGAPGELDVSTDDWTLHVEGWPAGVAWLAIDDDPDEPGAMRAARRAVLGVAVERAIAGIDRRLGGGLSRALAASGDPLTLDFVTALAEQQGQPDTR